MAILPPEPATSAMEKLGRLGELFTGRHFDREIINGTPTQLLALITAVEICAKQQFASLLACDQNFDLCTSVSVEGGGFSCPGFGCTLRSVYLRRADS